MKSTRSRSQVGPKAARMNERGEGSGQDSCVAPTGMSSSPALEPSRACVGPGHESSGAAGRTPTAQPTCSRAGAAAHWCLGRCREPTGRGALSAFGAAVGTAPAAPLKNCQGSDAGRKGPPNLLQSRVPGAPKSGPGSAQDGAKRAPRMEKPVLTKPTGAGAGEHGPAGPGAPTGRQGEGRRRWRAPQRPRRRTLNPRAKSARRGAPEPPGGRRMRGLWGEHARPESAPSCYDRKCVRASGSDTQIILVVPAGLGKAL